MSSPREETRTHPPSMDSLLSSSEGMRLASAHGREALKEELRRAISRGATAPDDLLARARESLSRRFAPTLVRTVNATGVLLHTNLGRAPLGAAAREAVRDASEGYAALEYDRETGGRGRRQDHVRALARDLFGAPDAFVANNNAGGLLLALTALGRGRGALVSRGELVAIGGSFKVPEILEASGARLVEVGTTNRTTIEDYRRALSPEIGLLLTVHPSNYEIRGFTGRPAPEELAALAAEARLPWIHDQGTGCVVPLDEFGVPGETTVAQCLGWGATLVAFSGDKLLAGPQAGMLVGAEDAIARSARHPVARAVRPDKLTLAALAATLRDWKRGAWRDFPVYRAAALPIEDLERRGAALARTAPPALAAEVRPSRAVFGGGTSPEKTFPSRALVLGGDASADALAARLRERAIPVVARVEDDRVWIDLRSVAPEEDSEVGAALAELR